MKLIGYREGNYGEKQEPARKKKSPKFAWWVVWNVILRAGGAFAKRLILPWRLKITLQVNIIVKFLNSIKRVIRLIRVLTRGFTHFQKPKTEETKCIMHQTTTYDTSKCKMHQMIRLMLSFGVIWCILHLEVSSSVIYCIMHLVPSKFNR